MTTLSYPTNADLQTIAQVLVPKLTQDDLLFQLMPVQTKDSSIIMWEQKDNYTGLQQLRGLNGEPPKVQPIGQKQYVMLPGVYGEYMDIEEKEMTERRQFGQFSGSIDVSDLVMDRQVHLLQRRLDRQRYIGWTLLTTGQFVVANVLTGLTHADTFPLTTYAGSAWATAASGTPLADLRAIQLLGPPQGTDFNAMAMAIMNRTTANYLLANTNAADIGGKRTAGLANIMSMSGVNMLMTEEGLPNIVIYDDGYIPEGGSFTRFIPDKKIVVVGKRPANAPVAAYIMTRNANNDGMAPGAYMKIEDSGDQNKVPRTIKVHDGHNGGPVIYYPGSIVVMTVT